MKKALVILLVGVILAGGAWFFFFKGGDEAQPVNSEPQNFPARFDESGATAALETYESEFSSLAFDYPGNWNVTEAADNTEEAQLLTVESPLDENEFYFCLDLNVVSDDEEASFAITDAEVLAAKPLESGNYSVIYQVEGLKGVQWGVTDQAVEVGSDTFTNEIPGQSGDRMQLFGRFDCREDTKPDTSTEEFQDARWLREAEAIAESLSF